MKGVESFAFRDGFHGHGKFALREVVAGHPVAYEEPKRVPNRPVTSASRLNRVVDVLRIARARQSRTRAARLAMSPFERPLSELGASARS